MVKPFPIPISPAFEQLKVLQESSDPSDRGVIASSSDSQNAGHLYNNSFSTRPGNILFGKITYSTPYSHWYRVALDDGGADLSCCQVTDSSVGPFSIRGTAPLPPDTSVLLFRPEGSAYGYILGAVPSPVTDARLVHPDWISQGSGGGFKRELYYHGLLQLFSRFGSVVDFSNGRPLDSSALGEWGKISDLGGGFHLDPLFSFHRINENCGLFLYYMDDLARLEGHNLEIRSAIAELQQTNDSGEGLYYCGVSPYAWESLGVFSQETATSRTISDSDVQYSVPYGKIEPAFDDQQAFYRSEEYRGYLGQGWLRQVLLPPQNSADDVLRYSQESVFPGVFREQVGLDGSYGLQSAHSVVLAKRGPSPVAKRIKLPAAADGDSVTADNYRFAGTAGAGDPHLIGDIVADDDAKNLRQAVGMTDYLSHLFNWKGLHAFHYHAEDFYLPQPADMPAYSMPPRDFSALQQQTWLPAVVPVPLRVDDRYGKVDYYPVQASFALLPDGSSVWRGGGGEEIRFVGGNIQISCPGDVMLQPGRSAVIYAGADIVLRANKSADISANQNDVRIKAEKNLEMLSGNSGSGRMLLENKASGIDHDYQDKLGEDIAGAGILFKAARSQVVAWGSEIYLRTGVGDTNAGNIVLDSGVDIRTKARNFIRHLSNIAADYFGSPETVVANTFSAHNAQIQTSCQFDGGLVVTEGGMTLNGNLGIIGGHVGTERANEFKGYVGLLKDDTLQSSKTLVDEVVADMGVSRGQGNTDYEDNLTNWFYAANRAGNDDAVSFTQFSFRTEQQYGTTAWELPETYWQQLSRESGQQSNVWTENPVIYQEAYKLGPHPGYIRWIEAHWLTQALVLHDADTGIDAEIGAAYEQPEFPAWDRKSADGNYPVIG